MRRARRSEQPTSDELSVERVAMVVEKTELAVTQHQVERWGQLERLTIDLEARSLASELALGRDLELLEWGMQRANGSRVAQELVLRYVDDQNQDFRDEIRRVMD